MKKKREESKPKVEIGRMREVMDELVDWVKVHKECYNVAEFAIDRGIDPIEMVEDWVGRVAGYDRQLRIAQEVIKSRVINDAMKKRVDGPFAKFLLQVSHGMDEPPTRLLVQKNWKKKLDEVLE